MVKAVGEGTVRTKLDHDPKSETSKGNYETDLKSRLHHALPELQQTKRQNPLRSGENASQDNNPKTEEHDKEKSGRSGGNPE